MAKIYENSGTPKHYRKPSKSIVEKKGLTNDQFSSRYLKDRLVVEKIINVQADDTRIFAEVFPHRLFIGKNRNGEREVSLRVNFNSTEIFELVNVADEIEFSLSEELFKGEWLKIENWSKDVAHKFAATLSPFLSLAIKAHFIAVACYATDKNGIIPNIDIADAIERLGQNLRRETKKLLKIRSRGRGKNIHTPKRKSENDKQRDINQRADIIRVINELYPPNSAERPSKKRLAEKLGITIRGLSGRLKRLGISDLEELQTRG